MSIRHFLLRLLVIKDHAIVGKEDMSAGTVDPEYITITQ